MSHDSENDLPGGDSSQLDHDDPQAIARMGLLQELHKITSAVVSLREAHDDEMPADVVACLDRIVTDLTEVLSHLNSDDSKPAADP